MATETVQRLIDDLDGKDATKTVTYTWDGQAYEIDLSDDNAQEFADAVGPYIAASRKVGKGSQPKKAQAAKPSAEVDVKAVRKWAAQNGIDVNPRGRLSSTVLEQYKAAQ